MAGAGDVNGDGYADVIVGAFLYDAGQSDEGAAFVFLGSGSGIASAHLADGRVISVPLAWYPRLLNATPEQREKIDPFVARSEVQKISRENTNENLDQRDGNAGPNRD